MRTKIRHEINKLKKKLYRYLDERPLPKAWRTCRLTNLPRLMTWWSSSLLFLSASLLSQQLLLTCYQSTTKLGGFDEKIKGIRCTILCNWYVWLHCNLTWNNAASVSSLITKRTFYRTFDLPHLQFWLSMRCYNLYSWAINGISLRVQVYAG